MTEAKRRRRKRIALVATVTCIAPVLLAAWQIEAIVDWAMTPAAGFDAQSPPPPPRYDDDASWSALPSRVDAADQAPNDAPAIAPADAPADVFYIHPTTYVGGSWNATTTDEDLNQATDRVATGIQASAFNGCCAVYAPRYRQANGTAFFRPSADGHKAIDVAYSDVARAFDVFLARRGRERPFILAAHSQGSVLGERLLEERIAGTSLRDRLVAAYLIGGEVTVAGLAERAPDIPPCRAPDDLHCVVAWAARGPSFQPTRFEFQPSDERERLCTNPLSWKMDAAPVPADENLGAVFLETGDASPRKAFADARCDRGTLVVSHIGTAPRDVPSRILDHVMGAGNYHPIEYQMFFMNLRENAQRRVATIVSRPATGP